MKYNDYIILTDEDYNNMKNKYNHLDEMDKEKLLDIYNKLLEEYRELERLDDGRYIGIQRVSSNHIKELKEILIESGVDIVEKSSEEIKPQSRSPYFNPLSRLFSLNHRPRPYSPFDISRRELDILDLLLLFMLTRPHSRHCHSICRIAHERVAMLSSLNAG